MVTKNASAEPDRRLVGLGWISARWDCSRQTARRILDRNGVPQVLLGGGRPGGVVRFDVEDVLRVERIAQQSARTSTRDTDS